MEQKTIDFEALSAVFAPFDLEWRMQSGRIGDKGPWIRVITYVTNRAIQNRLDEVCGPANWQNRFEITPKGVLCGIGIRVDGEWIWKWDGADESDIEPFKGSLSGAMKRAASTGWGIGRYLYNLTESFAAIDNENGQYTAWLKRDPKNKAEKPQKVRWNPPPLPNWALPGTDARERPTTNANADNGVTTQHGASAQHGSGVSRGADGVDQVATLVKSIKDELHRQETAGLITHDAGRKKFSAAGSCNNDIEKLTTYLEQIKADGALIAEAKQADQPNMDGFVEPSGGYDA